MNAGAAYLERWGLREQPFELAPDTRYAYERADHREGLARLLFGLTQLGGIVVITGEIGCGKTLLAQTLGGALHGRGFRVATIANPPRTPAALLDAALAALELGPVGGSTARRAGAVRELLRRAAESGERVVLAVDEAQRLGGGALEELRLLTNSEGAPGAGLVLLGQPELSALVRRRPQVAQRIVVRYHMGAMAPDEVDRYVRHRTRVAGATGRIFSKRATEAVHAVTEGVPRLVNLLCASALFVGATREEDVVGEDTIRDLAEDRAWAEAAGARPA